MLFLIFGALGALEMRRFYGINFEELKDLSAVTYSVFSINRQQKIADPSYLSLLAHSVFIIPVFGAAEITIGGNEFVCEGTTVVHVPAGQT